MNECFFLARLAACAPCKEYWRPAKVMVCKQSIALTTGFDIAAGKAGSPQTISTRSSPFFACARVVLFELTEQGSCSSSPTDKFRHLCLKAPDACGNTFKDGRWTEVQFNRSLACAIVSDLNPFFAFQNARNTFFFGSPTQPKTFQAFSGNQRVRFLLPIHSKSAKRSGSS